MMCTIATSVLQAIVDHAVAAEPNEACGVLLGSDLAIADAVAAVNVAATPAVAFEIDPATLLAVHRDARATGRTVVGWYHSHPNGRAEPSATDAVRAVEDDRLWLIAAAQTVSAWRTTHGGRLHGRFDPVTLIAA